MPLRDRAAYFREYRRRAATKRDVFTARRLYVYLLHQAELRQLEVSVTLEDYKQLISNLCHYCNNKLPLYGVGLDRKDSKQGYTPTNVVPCCSTCNIAKNTMTQDQFKEWIIKIHSWWASKN